MDEKSSPSPCGGPKSRLVLYLRVTEYELFGRTFSSCGPLTYGTICYDICRLLVSDHRDEGNIKSTVE